MVIICSYVLRSSDDNLIKMKEEAGKEVHKLDICRLNSIKKIKNAKKLSEFQLTESKREN